MIVYSVEFRNGYGRISVCPVVKGAGGGIKPKPI